MKLAVLADVHANLPALEAVLESLEGQAVDRLVVLGDLVGYHAEPSRVCELLMEKADIIVAGNHDRDLARKKPREGTRKAASVVQAWTREQLTQDELSGLTALRNIYIEPGAFVAVHGCYLNTEHYYGYVTSTMLETNLEAIGKNPEWPRVALCGHTHVPLCAWRAEGKISELSPVGRVHWDKNSDVVLCNPGAVGQPRDGDPRASYGVLDTDEGWFEVRRVKYDLGRTCAAMQEADLPEELVTRLMEGR